TFPRSLAARRARRTWGKQGASAAISRNHDEYRWRPGRGHILRALLVQDQKPAALRSARPGRRQGYTLSNMARPSQRPATLDDFWAIPEEQRFHELIGGQLTEKAGLSGEHGHAQAGVVGAVVPPFQRKGGSGGPGGWWIATEVELLLTTGDVVRPDVVGWRRQRSPERPVGNP